MEKSILIAIGKITGVHGLTGNLKVWSYSDSIDTFTKGARVQLRGKNEPAGSDYRILKAAPYKKGILLVLEGVDNRNKAEALIGKEMYILRDELPALEESDTFYRQDLMGLDVIDRNRGHIGTIDHIFETGANDVLVVKNEPDRVETLVPFISSVIVSVDLSCRQMHVDLPEGL